MSSNVSSASSSAANPPKPSPKKKVGRIVALVMTVWTTVQTFTAGLSLCSQVQGDSDWTPFSQIPGGNFSPTPETTVIYVFIIAQISIMVLLVLRRIITKRILKQNPQMVFLSMWTPGSQLLFLPVSFACVSLWAKYTLIGISSSPFSSSLQTVEVSAFVGPALGFLAFHAGPLAFITWKSTNSIPRTAIAVLSLMLYWCQAIIGIFSFGYLSKMEAINNQEFELTTRQNLLISSVVLMFFPSYTFVSIFIDFKSFATNPKAEMGEKYFRAIARSPIAAVLSLYIIVVQFYVYFSSWSHCNDGVLAPFNYCAFQQAMVVIWGVVLLASLIKSWFFLAPMTDPFWPIFTAMMKRIIDSASDTPPESSDNPGTAGSSNNLTSIGTADGVTRSSYQT